MRGQPFLGSRPDLRLASGGFPPVHSLVVEFPQKGVPSDAATAATITIALLHPMALLVAGGVALLCLLALWLRRRRSRAPPLPAAHGAPLPSVEAPPPCKPPPQWHPKPLFTGRYQGDTVPDRQSFALLLRWFADCTALGHRPPLTLGVNAEGLRGLFVTEEVLPGEVLLALPVSLCLAERGAPRSTDDGHADGALMAVELLRDRDRWRRGSVSRWGPYHDLLSGQGSTPPLQYTATEVGAMQDQFTLQQARRLRQRAERSWATLPDHLRGDSHDDFLWALSAISSRCFQQGQTGRYVLAPILDLANHSFRPSCVVDHVNPHAMELQAGPRGLRPGEEVTVCYGEWPSEAFFLFFGFVPTENPFDDVVLFGDADDLADAYLEVTGCKEHSHAELVDIIEGACEGDAQRLFATATGLDERLMTSLLQLNADPAVAFAVLGHRTRQLLAAYPTTLEQDGALLAGGGLSPHAVTAVQFRRTWKRLLRRVEALLHCQETRCGT